MSTTLARPLLPQLALLACAAAAGGLSAWGLLGGSCRGAAVREAPPCDAALLPRLLDWEAAQAVARARNLPLLVLLAPPHAGCPPARSLVSRLLTGAALEQLSTCCVPASLVVDSGAPSSTAAAFLARYGDTLLPCLVVLSPCGDVLQRQFSRLYPTYDAAGAARPLEQGEELLAAPEVVALVDAAVGRGQREGRRLLQLAGRAEPEAQLEAIGLLERRGRLAEALSAARRAASAGLVPGDALRVACALARLGDVPAATEVLEAALRREPPEAVRDRLALLFDRLAGLPAHDDAARGLPALESVAVQAAARGDADVELEAQTRLAGRALVRGDRRAVERDLEWVAGRLSSLPVEAERGVQVLSELTRLAVGVGRPQTAAGFQRELMRRYPERPEAQEPRHGLLCELEGRTAPAAH